MTAIDSLAASIRRIVSSGPPADAEELARILADVGWESIDRTPVPFSRLWQKDGIQAEILDDDDDDDDGASLDIVLGQLAPDLDDPSYLDAINNSYTAQVSELERMRRELFDALAGESNIELVSDPTEIEDFTIGSDWRLDGFVLSFGIEHVDVNDMPILLVLKVHGYDTDDGGDDIS
jgi:hypothetical protein